MGATNIKWIELKIQEAISNIVADKYEENTIFVTERNYLQMFLKVEGTF